MRRDDDLLRELMMMIEAGPDPLFTHPLADWSDDHEEKTYFHLMLLVDEGFLEERQHGVFRMTMEGHDFVAAVRDDTIWSKTKGALRTVGGASISMMKDVALGYVRQELIKLGLPLG